MGTATDVLGVQSLRGTSNTLIRRKEKVILLPYINTTPKDYPMVFEEDNLQEVFGQMLIDNGWTLARHFYKTAHDTRAHWRITDRVRYATAYHTIYRNAEGKLLGIATVAHWSVNFLRSGDVVRRVNDDINPDDENFGISPSWEYYAKNNYIRNVTKTHLYFYMLEKLPNGELVQDGGIVSTLVMPGMSGTSFSYDEDRDVYREGYYRAPGRQGEYDKSEDMEFEGKILSASRSYMTRAVLDIEVLETEWNPTNIQAEITKTDPIVMQSPIVESSLRAYFLEHVEQPVWHTNWWTDSEVSVQGHVDSTGFFLILQADNVPMWESNVVPTIPLYFGKVRGLQDEKEDNGYALFSGTVPPEVGTSSGGQSTFMTMRHTKDATEILVADGSKLPEPPVLLTFGGKEVVRLVSVDGNRITVDRGVQDTGVDHYWERGTRVAKLESFTDTVPKHKRVSFFDFDDANATAGRQILPLLKMYPGHPGNGIDNVITSRSRFGSRYQAHYLSWNAPANQIPPVRMAEDGRKYSRAYEPVENTKNYKYQFNPSRYSDKIHSSRIFVVHPEEGIRGYLDVSIGFDAQSISSTSKLRVRKQNCPEKIYDMYRYLSVGAVSPLTKRPATQFRPAGVGIFMEEFNPNEEPHDIENDTTPPSEVSNLTAESIEAQTIDIYFEIPDDKDYSHLNIYVDGELYATGVTRTDWYKIVGLTTGFMPEVVVKTVDLAGNESAGVKAPTVKVV